MTTDELQRIPFLRLLGVELAASGPGSAELQLELKDEHLNSWGVAHGGVLMALLDVAMARAGRSLLADGDNAAAVTVEMKTSFFRPARGRLRACGKVLHRSTTMMYCEAELFDGGGELAAKALGTFKFLRRAGGAARIT
jgi:uncharacterized protein (TIGR00369 family)